MKWLVGRGVTKKEKKVDFAQLRGKDKILLCKVLKQSYETEGCLWGNVGACSNKMKDIMPKKLGTRIISRLSSTEIERREVSLRILDHLKDESSQD